MYITRACAIPKISLRGQESSGNAHSLIDRVGGCTSVHPKGDLAAESKFDPVTFFPIFLAGIKYAG